MVEDELMKALVELVKDATKDLLLPLPGNTSLAPRRANSSIEDEPQGGDSRVAPTVFDGYLPPRQSEFDDKHPFVVVRAQSATTEDELTNVSVTIIIGVYSEDINGYQYALSVMSKIRNALFNLDGGVLSRRFILNRPIKWESADPQPYPNWALKMDTSWSMIAPAVTLDLTGGLE